MYFVVVGDEQRVRCLTRRSVSCRRCSFFFHQASPVLSQDSVNEPDAGSAETRPDAAGNMGSK